MSGILSMKWINPDKRLKVYDDGRDLINETKKYMDSYSEWLESSIKENSYVDEQTKTMLKGARDLTYQMIGFEEQMLERDRYTQKLLQQNNEMLKKLMDCIDE